MLLIFGIPLVIPVAPASIILGFMARNHNKKVQRKKFTLLICGIVFLCVTQITNIIAMYHIISGYPNSVEGDRLFMAFAQMFLILLQIIAYILFFVGAIKDLRSRKSEEILTPDAIAENVAVHYDNSHRNKEALFTEAQPLNSTMYYDNNHRNNEALFTDAPAQINAMYYNDYNQIPTSHNIQDKPKMHKVIIITIALCILLPVGCVVGCSVYCATAFGWRETSIEEPIPMEINEKITSISASGGTSFVILDDGSLLSWGALTFVWEAYGGRTVGSHRVPIDDVRRPHDRETENSKDQLRVLDTSAIGVRSIMVHSVALTNDGTLRNINPHSSRHSSMPNRQRLSQPNISLSIIRNSPENIIAVSGNSRHMMVITADGILYGWGDNDYGQLGDGTTISRAPRSHMESVDPVAIMDDVVYVSSGTNHTMAITSDGTLWGWGSNNAGQVGDNTTIDRSSPVEIMSDVITVSSGSNYTMAITADGTLWGWGSRLIGNLAGSNIPVQIMADVIHVSAGNNHVLAITSDNALWAWGRNGSNDNHVSGLLGNGTMVDNFEPTIVMHDVIYAVAANSHSMALTEDGNLWTWGRNSSGQLGTGTSYGRFEYNYFMPRGDFSTAWISPILILEYVPLP